jgi:hypothetical protein
MNFTAGAVAEGVGAEAKGDTQGPPTSAGEDEDAEDGNESNGFHEDKFS